MCVCVHVQIENSACISRAGSRCVSLLVFAGAGAAVCVGLRRGGTVCMEQRLSAAVSKTEPQRHW